MKKACRAVAWLREPSGELCACGCGQFITNRAVRNKALRNASAGYVKGHTWKGRAMPESACAKMRGHRPALAGERNPNYGKGLFGASNPNWHGGHMGLRVKGNLPGAYSKKDLEFRAKIKKRDGRCVLCGKECRLSTHHIEQWLEREDLRYDERNVVALCPSCHTRADNAHHMDRIKPMLVAYIQSIYQA